jgi:hypothetical protein
VEGVGWLGGSLGNGERHGGQKQDGQGKTHDEQLLGGSVCS